MISTYSTLRAGLTALKNRTGLSMAKMMLGAKIKGEQINSRYLAKLSSPGAASRTLATLSHLVDRHGASPEELLVPPLLTRTKGSCAVVVRPTSPYHLRMTQAEFVADLEKRNYRIDDINDPVCQVLTVFGRPTPSDKFLKVLGVGRATVLAIEAGLNTPESLESALANSPESATAPLMQAAAMLSDNQPMTSSRTMAVYVPPDVLVTCALVTYIRRIEFLGVDAVGHYAAAPAVSRTRKPADPELSGDSARILSAAEFPLPQ